MDRPRLTKPWTAPANVEVLQGQGHSPQMEAAGEVNRLVEDFLASAAAP